MGIFIALAFFLIPIAYLYDGKTKKKILWVASGLALLLVLNLVRMASISLAWLALRPEPDRTSRARVLWRPPLLPGDSANDTDVEVLRLGDRKINGTKSKAGRQYNVSSICVAAALAFSLAYLFLTLNYSSSLNISPIVLAQRTTFNFTNAQILKGPVGHDRQKQLHQHSDI